MKFYRHHKLKIACLLAACLSLSSCAAPIIIGGGLTAIGIAGRDKKISDSFSDTKIAQNIRGKINKFNPKIYEKITVNVQNGDVLLLGNVNEENWKTECEKISWQVAGVNSINNYIEIGPDQSAGDIAKDAWLTTRAKSTLSLTSGINSLNYSIKTVNSTMYVMGVAKSQKELDKVNVELRKIGGVKRLVCLAKLIPQIPTTVAPNNESSNVEIIESTTIKNTDETTQPNTRKS